MSLLRLIAKGDLAEVRRVLNESPQLVNVREPHPFWGGQPQPLHVAIETNRRDMFDLLLDAGADVNGSNDRYDGWSPLMIAIDRDGMRDELLRRGARVGVVEALMMGDDRRLDELIEREGLPSAVPNGGSLLMFARTVHAIDRLAALSVPIDKKDRWGITPIEALYRLGEKGTPLVERLTAHGARLEMTADEMLIAAVQSRHVAEVRRLLSAGANVNARLQRTPLHVAAWNGDLPMVELLLEAGADPTALDDEHHTTPRQWAETAIKVRNDPQCAVVATYLATTRTP